MPTGSEHGVGPRITLTSKPWLNAERSLRYYMWLKFISSTFSRKSEAFASEISRKYFGNVYSLRYERIVQIAC